MYIERCVYIHIHIYICINISMFICIYMHVYIHVHFVYSYVCIACIYVVMCKYVCVWWFMYLCLHCLLLYIFSTITILKSYLLTIWFLLYYIPCIFNILLFLYPMRQVTFVSHRIKPSLYLFSIIFLEAITDTKTMKYDYWKN